MHYCKSKTIASWVFQCVAAGILAQTLYFKFTGAEESRYIFTTLGVEPWGRIATGCLELVAAVLLLTPRTAVFGALFSVGLMTGAVGSHLTRLGVIVQNDSGLLFTLAITVLACSGSILVLRRRELPFIGGFFSQTCESGCAVGERFR
jgi:hypothetical protein